MRRRLVEQSCDRSPTLAQIDSALRFDVILPVVGFQAIDQLSIKVYVLGAQCCGQLFCIQVSCGQGHAHEDEVEAALPVQPSLVGISAVIIKISVPLI